MGEKPNCLRGAAGYSMLEVMIGGLLLGLIALALLPAFLSLSNSLKVNAFQTECNAIVRASTPHARNSEIELSTSFNPLMSAEIIGAQLLRLLEVAKAM